MEIRYLQSVDSTHTYLKNYIKQNGYTNNLCIATQEQTSGIGSRGNSWVGVKGNLFFSFVIKQEDLPPDLQIQSASIYFSYILKKILKSFGSKLWLKWPNDFYIDNNKIGGTITSVSNGLVYCGIGLNLNNVNNEFLKLDIKIDVKELFKLYFKNIEKKILWEDILKEYVVEFSRSKNLYATINNEKIPLINAQLNSDGSININNKKVFSLR
ncbi:MAG: biotin--[acetyl-CoA-carboxylase] ligase [Arcobacter sp.]|uniref:biotin--[acetyl-CoA-carboxylase] ligase n=1 Tax=uncultured Arcobacter sp. TaxID=165434 RepID=UPI000CB432A0|nr:biotin--[acetyl-CoA-carboxylase] ligase [uncultured Arcobacter sp.]PLY10287.1 MAG: biotin--[acetyl-CoA-carboxylase] ligase [Arcobacter sp.]